MVLDVVFFQLIAHYSGNNSVSFNLLNRAGTFVQALDTFPQTQSGDSVYITYPVDIPQRSGAAVIQSIFNTTSGGGAVYYSCVDINLVAAPDTSTTGTTGAASSLFASIALIVAAIAALL